MSDPRIQNVLSSCLSPKSLSWMLLLGVFASLLVGCSSAVTPSSLPPRPSGADAPGTVLFVLSGADTQTLANGTKRSTGYFLGEFFGPYERLIEDGYSVEFATADGRRPVVDPKSLKPSYFKSPTEEQRAKAWLKNDAEQIEILSLEQALAQVDNYQGMIVPGGQGVMVDLLRNQKVHKLVVSLAERERAIGLICHAPAILTELPDENPLRGRSVTSVSPFEEFYIETFVMGSDAVDRKIGKRLRRAGYDYDSALPKSNYAKRDCNLVTSQNPFSGEAFETHFLNALWSARNGEPCDAR